MARGIRLAINLRRRRLAAVVAGGESEAQGAAAPSEALVDHPLHRDACDSQVRPSDPHRSQLKRLYVGATVTL